MLGTDVEICMILKTKEETSFFSNVFKKMGYKNITQFTSASDALEVALKKQFGLFITRMEMPGLSGVVMIQKMRATGNYGMELHLFIADIIEGTLVNTLIELELNYVLVKPFTFDRIKQKIDYLVKSENSLTEFETQYRDAKSAFNTNMLEMAEDYANKLLKIDPTSERVLSLLGDIFFNSDRMEDAKKKFELILTINPNSSIASNKLSQIYMANKEFKKASDILNKLADVNPYNIKILENTGLSNLEIGDTEKAKKITEKLSTIDKNNKVASEVTAHVEIKNGNVEKGIASLSKSHSEKELVSFFNNKGVNLVREKKIPEAIDMYKDCISKLKKNKFLYVVHFNLGFAYYRTGDLKNAQQYLNNAVELKPDFEKAKNILNKISSTIANRGKSA